MDNEAEAGRTARLAGVKRSSSMNNSREVEDMNGIWWELVKMFLTALLASTLTHLLTHRRFIQGRWWDRKADAYGKIVGSLVGMAHSLEWWIEMVSRGSSGWMEFVEPYEAARKEVERVAIEGDYVVSRKASETLAGLMKMLKQIVAPGLDPLGPRASSLLLDDLEERRKKIKSCLEVLREEAKSDLSVKWQSWF